MSPDPPQLQASTSTPASRSTPAAGDRWLPKAYLEAAACTSAPTIHCWPWAAGYAPSTSATSHPRPGQRALKDNATWDFGLSTSPGMRPRRLVGRPQRKDSA